MATKKCLQRGKNHAYNLLTCTQVRGFAYHPDESWRRELDLSPAMFVESSEHPGIPDVMRRKDDIIRARNAQIASLYEQLHTRGAWEV